VLFILLFLAFLTAYGQQSAMVAITNMVDERDGKRYKVVKIGQQTWMAENLAYEAKGSKCFEKDCYKESDDGEYICNKLSESEIKANCKKYGRLYNFNTAKTVCPSGWHLPSDAEWKILVSSVGGEKTAGKYLKSTSGWNNVRGKKYGNGEDKYGFSALPGGFGGYYEVEFHAVGYSGYWWSSSSAYFYIGCDSEDAHLSDDGNIILYSVRCVQD